MDRLVARVGRRVNRLGDDEYRIELRTCCVGGKTHWDDIGRSYWTWRAACLAALKMGYDVNVIEEVF